MPIAFQQVVENLSTVGAWPKTTRIEERFSLIKREWERFMTGGDVDAGVIPPEIVEAWRRCRALKLDPFCQAVPAFDMLAGQHLEALLADSGPFIEISRPFIDNLYEFVKDSGFSIALFNDRGVILDARRDDRYLQTHQFSRWTPGVQWSDRQAGNNIVSFVLDRKKPCQLFGPHHYLQMYQYVTASGAPIFDPAGRLAGGIALSSHLYASNDHTLGMAVAAAHAIANEYRMQQAYRQCQSAYLQTDLALGLQKAILMAMPEALLAVDEHNRVLLFNDPARKKFALDDNHGEGKSLDDLFAGRENAPFLHLVGHYASIADAEIRITVRKETMECLLTAKPITSPTGKTIGKILIFSEAKRIHSLVTRMIGARANFHFEDICGANPRFLSSIEQARTVSRSDSNVLLLGESGTGKDLFAQAIHNASPRHNGPYVAINCGAIPRELVASELFGHTEGSFTGSRRGGHQGKFKLADGGTIFLDEIAEMPMDLQTTLLRVIEDKCIIPLGGSRIRKVDVRVIAASNKDLREEVRRGTFRKDLYYRINVFTIHLLPLAERTDDIPLLVERFVKKYGHVMGRRIDTIDPKLMQALGRYPWPGNVRELQNVIERMMNIASGRALTLEMLPSEILHYRETASVAIESPQDFERHLMAKMMAMNCSKSEMARKLNITRSTLYRKLTRYGLSCEHRSATEMILDKRSIDGMAASKGCRPPAGLPGAEEENHSSNKNKGDVYD